MVDIKKKFIIKSEKEFFERLNLELEQAILPYFNQGLRVIRQNGVLVDVKSIKGKEVSKKVKEEALILGEKILALARLEDSPKQEGEH